MFYLIIDLLGLVAFAISGVLAALHKRLDIFGVFIIAFVTAVGGGTIRDILIGINPVTWLQNNVYMYTIIITVILALIFREKLKYLRTSLFLFDTIGIGLYTLIGVEKGVAADLSAVMCIALGTITACFGGVIRDILCNDIPVIFHKEIYATACVAGGGVYFLLKLLPIPEDAVFILSIIIVITIRLLAVKFKLALPSIYKN
ncbi:trimeric intracellular cation channel family protein [Sinomicrobium weinanense]|uniref:Trimeric intracellular cation channel family protein n=1 Tax=Sinomicrobium weinanense TaxID=2842200 RepID=A0A926Q408_9FLAO|nr:trimeric intracellular cation channel family protein [Sinomicrobium weinanense]MBC9796571.1 trimeric intracellular cation channel family protein [Sinomicrobium weinanense]MBU3123555.1 trimeric intracellular cation channel family protein [Sinomicrobium weinanense]